MKFGKCRYHVGPPAVGRPSSRFIVRLNLLLTDGYEAEDFIKHIQIIKR